MSTSHPSSGIEWDAVQIAADDDIAFALRDLEGRVRIRSGDRVSELVLHEPIPLGHKFALRDLARGTEVRKYGWPIGVATKPIPAGHHVHVHNLASQRAGSGKAQMST